MTIESHEIEEFKKINIGNESNNEHHEAGTEPPSNTPR